MVPGMGKIENTFDGLKLARQYEDNGTMTGTDYCGPFVYETVSGVRSLKNIVTVGCGLGAYS